MVLSTSTPAGRPSSRVVLLRGVSEAGFTFFTNYDSRKGDEIESNPHAALLFYWAETGKQIRIEGTITKAPKEVSDEYFASRPRGNKLGAIASPQSKVIEGREALESRYAELEKELAGGEIARPENWGGYILAPETYEFWQGRESRLHDRLRFTKKESGWEIVRLAP
jgi:pyridoxamine 5'-phosphate oxidase